MDQNLIEPRAHSAQHRILIADGRSTLNVPRTSSPRAIEVRAAWPRVGRVVRTDESAQAPHEQLVDRLRNAFPSACTQRARCRRPPGPPSRSVRPSLISLGAAAGLAGRTAGRARRPPASAGAMSRGDSGESRRHAAPHGRCPSGVADHHVAWMAQTTRPVAERGGALDRRVRRVAPERTETFRPCADLHDDLRWGWLLRWLPAGTGARNRHGEMPGATPPQGWERRPAGPKPSPVHTTVEMLHDGLVGLPVGRRAGEADLALLHRM